MDNQKELRSQLDEMRRQYEMDRPLLGEEVYADLMHGLSLMEDHLAERQAKDTSLIYEIQQIASEMLPYADTSQYSVDQVPSDGSLTWRQADTVLRVYGYSDNEVSRMMQFASFIQARGWIAVPPSYVDTLRQKYSDAGIDPFRIDFSV